MIFVSIPYSSGLSFRLSSNNVGLPLPVEGLNPLFIRSQFQMEMVPFQAPEKFAIQSQSLIHQVSVSDPSWPSPACFLLSSQSLIHQVSVSDERIKSVAERYKKSQSLIHQVSVSDNYSRNE